jgi:hypothetical protein
VVFSTIAPKNKARGALLVSVCRLFFFVLRTAGAPLLAFCLGVEQRYVELSG